MFKLNFLIIILSTVLFCSKSSDSSAAAGDNTTTTAASPTQTCRKYATNITDTTNSFTYTCTYNGSTTVTCTNGGTATITYTYPNLGTFVEEGAAPISTFNRTRASGLVINDAASNGQHNYAHTYNSFGQLTGATDSGPGFAVSYTYTAWDAYNRPTTGTAAFTSGLVCTGRVLSIAYVDGTTRNKTYTFSGGVGANCSSLASGVDVQNADGNPVSSVLGRNYTVNATATQCYTPTTDATAPTIGTAISFASVAETTLTVNWGTANDAVTVPANLQYKLVKATASTAIDTVAKVDAISGVDLIQDYTTNTATKNVTGLTGGTTYFFAVVVKDAAGNKSLYAPVSQLTQTCRKYATNITDTTNSYTYTCTFNGSTTVNCTNGGTATITYTYPNLQTFVNESAAPLSVFNRTRASTLVFNDPAPSGSHNFTYTYNGSNQLTGITDSGTGFSTSYTYTAWDANNRPTTGTVSFTSGAVCTGRVISITYVDGTTRTKAYSMTGGVGANCSSLASGTDQQDADGNPLQTIIGSRNYTVNATTTQCY